MCKADEARLMIANAEIAPPQDTEGEIVLANMRGACVTVGNVVHTLFRLSSRASHTKSSG